MRKNDALLNEVKAFRHEANDKLDKPNEHVVVAAVDSGKNSAMMPAY